MKIMENNYLLTIAIPTFNRAPYLKKSLAQLKEELQHIPNGLVQIIISDNCSSDETEIVVKDGIIAGMNINYIKNSKNIGWARNFVQCFKLSVGNYVLLMGDDDLIVDGGLLSIIENIRYDEFGVVCLQPFGFDIDHRKEKPNDDNGEDLVFDNPQEFILKTQRYFTLTSACVINKNMLKNVKPEDYIDTDLAVFHLFLRAALAAKKNKFIKKYTIASKRQNSFSYDYVQVFVVQFWKIIEAHVKYGLDKETIYKLKKKRLLSYYPFYLLGMRISSRENVISSYNIMRTYFNEFWLFRYYVAPILVLPRFIAIIWGVITTVIGRLINGEMKRGIKFSIIFLLRCFKVNTEKQI
jgi:abequosyltransferase